MTRSTEPDRDDRSVGRVDERVDLGLRYGATGRPQHRYAWRG
ncbi:MAG TPA: hypothetical protein VI452_15265 [Marmoricola sp.]